MANLRRCDAGLCSQGFKSIIWDKFPQSVSQFFFFAKQKREIFLGLKGLKKEKEKSEKKKREEREKEEKRRKEGFKREKKREKEEKERGKRKGKEKEKKRRRRKKEGKGEARKKKKDPKAVSLEVFYIMVCRTLRVETLFYDIRGVLLSRILRCLTSSEVCYNR